MNAEEIAIRAWINLVGGVTRKLTRQPTLIIWGPNIKDPNTEKQGDHPTPIISAATPPPPPMPIVVPPSPPIPPTVIIAPDRYFYV